MPIRDINLDLIGSKFGYLSVVGFVTGKFGRSYIAICDCGKWAFKNGWAIKSGKLKSCGCRRFQKSSNKEASKGKRSPEYRTWLCMKDRCCNPNSTGFKNYGARGITICERWRSSYVNFVADMGRKPTPKHSIDRINNEGNYEPSNCRWATSKEQANNRRPMRPRNPDWVYKNSGKYTHAFILSVEVDGKVIPLFEAAKLMGITYHQAHYRLFKKEWRRDNAPKFLSAKVASL